MPRRKKPHRFYVGKIRVLLVDADDMARNAWKRILRKSSQIEVVGESTPSGFFRDMRNTSEPEIIVAGFAYVDDCLVRVKKVRKLWENVPKTIIICRNKEEIKAAFIAGADWAIAVPFDDQELITRVRASSDDAKRLCSEFRSALKSIRDDEASEEAYLKLIQDVLQLLFHP